MANAYTRPNVVASGTTWAQLQAGGLAGTLLDSLAAQAQPGSPTAAPTVAPTVAATSDTGSTLTTGTWYALQTETNGFGETTAGPASTGQAITSGTNHLTVTTTSTLKSGNTGANIYLSLGSNTGPFNLAAAGIAANTAVAFSAPIANSWSAQQPPATNTTALSTKQIELIRTVANGDARRIFQHTSDVLRDFLRGDPVTYNDMIKKFGDADAAVSVLYKVFGEIGALIVANPGTLGKSAIVGNLYPKAQRTWP